jgi:hypothetical protein
MLFDLVDITAPLFATGHLPEVIVYPSHTHGFSETVLLLVLAGIHTHNTDNAGIYL